MIFFWIFGSFSQVLFHFFSFLDVFSCSQICSFFFGFVSIFGGTRHFVFCLAGPFFAIFRMFFPGFVSGFFLQINDVGEWFHWFIR